MEKNHKVLGISVIATIIIAVLLFLNVSSPILVSAGGGGGYGGGTPTTTTTTTVVSYCDRYPWRCIPTTTTVVSYCDRYPWRCTTTTTTPTTTTTVLEPRGSCDPSSDSYCEWDSEDGWIYNPPEITTTTTVPISRCGEFPSLPECQRTTTTILPDTILPDTLTPTTTTPTTTIPTTTTIRERRETSTTTTTTTTLPPVVSASAIGSCEGTYTEGRCGYEDTVTFSLVYENLPLVTYYPSITLGDGGECSVIYNLGDGTSTADEKWREGGHSLGGSGAYDLLWVIRSGDIPLNCFGKTVDVISVRLYKTEDHQADSLAIQG